MPKDMAEFNLIPFTQTAQTPSFTTHLLRDMIKQKGKGVNQK